MSPRPLSYYCLIAFFIFLVVFPKGGIKIGLVPITWGYLLIGILSFFSFWKKRLSFSRKALSCFLMWVPFQVLTFFHFLVYGSENTPLLIAFIVTFFLLPFSFFLLFSETIQRISSVHLQKMLVPCLRFLTIFGLIIFFIKWRYGYFFEIPFLTVNFGDIGTLASEKYIDRGGLFKLISTYNNGNLFGICVLMLFPIYYEYETKIVWKILIRAALILTLSRTVWVGLIIVEGILFFSKSRSFLSFLKIAMITAISGFTIYFLSKTYIEKEVFLFLFDLTLGGRISPNSFENLFCLFGNLPFYNIQEIIYLGMLESFGIMGLLLFIVAMAFPLLQGRFSFHKGGGIIGRRAMQGMILYLLLCFSDGCILLIPTMAIYYFLSVLSIRSVSEENFALN